MLRFRQKPLPERAEGFLKYFASNRSKNTMNLYRSSLHHFHRYLKQSRLQISDLKPEHFIDFDEDLARHNLKAVTRKNIKQQVRIYLKYLEEQDFLEPGFVKVLFPKYRAQSNQSFVEIPPLAARFIEVLAAINKPSTVNGYKTRLRSFYKLHWSEGRPEYDINRFDIENYLIELKNNQIGANQVRYYIMQIRRYLHWLYDHKKLKVHPDDLIKVTDFPKRVETLPRPFPPEVDLEIQKRLSLSNDIDYLGILLMRKCGLRVGELRNLTTDSVDEDLFGNYFLKVPPGKLNRERIIPLDPSSVELIGRIRHHYKYREKTIVGAEYLISNPSGKRRSRNHFAEILREITSDLHIPGNDITLHRLRHTFATQLLSAGISLSALKTLMGHRDIRMTLGYAAVTQETIRTQYFEALSKVQTKYKHTNFLIEAPDLNQGILQSLNEFNRAVNKYLKVNGNKHEVKINRLIGRVRAVQRDFKAMIEGE